MITLLVTKSYLPEHEEIENNHYYVSNEYIKKTFDTLHKQEVTIKYIHNLPAAGKFFSEEKVDGIIIPVDHNDKHTLQYLKNIFLKGNKAREEFQQLQKEGKVFEAWKYVPEYESANRSPRSKPLQERAREVHQPFIEWVKEYLK